MERKAGAASAAEKKGGFNSEEQHPGSMNQFVFNDVEKRLPLSITSKNQGSK
jgi:hypothetical protein